MPTNLNEQAWRHDINVIGGFLEAQGIAKTSPVDLAWARIKDQILRYAMEADRDKKAPARRNCCYIPDVRNDAGCQALAEWEIWDDLDRDPYNSTDSCSAHLGMMLGPSQAYRVLPIHREP
jgi:hypothetical protein